MSSPIARTPPASKSVAARSTFLDRFKLPRSEAISRLRINIIAMLALTVLTNLLPLPTPWTAISVVRSHVQVHTVYYVLCVLEVILMSLWSTNILQASYALRYPLASRPQPPPLPSPAKGFSTSPPARHLRGLSSTSSPPRQKSFSYAPSPVSSPSRTLTYTFPPSFDSFSSSIPSPPASPLAAYKGKHTPTIGRAFDGSVLSRLRRSQSDSDDD